MFFNYFHKYNINILYIQAFLQKKILLFIILQLIEHVKKQVQLLSIVRN